MSIVEQIAQEHIDSEGRGEIATAWIRSLSDKPISDGTWNRWLDLAFGTARQYDNNGRAELVYKCSVLAALRLMLLVSFEGKSQAKHAQKQAAIKGPELAGLVADYCQQYPDRVELLRTTPVALGVGFAHLPDAVAIACGPGYEPKWRRVLRQQCERAGVAWDQAKLYTAADIQAIAAEVKKTVGRGRPRSADDVAGDLANRRRLA